MPTVDRCVVFALETAWKNLMIRSDRYLLSSRWLRLPDTGVMRDDAAKLSRTSSFSVRTMACQTIIEDAGEVIFNLFSSDGSAYANETQLRQMQHISSVLWYMRRTHDE